MVLRKVLDGSVAPAVCVRVVRLETGIVKESESIKKGFCFFLGISEVKRECLLNSVGLFNSYSHVTTKKGCGKQVG